METEIAILFHNYNDSFDRVKRVLQDELPRSLRLFNIRLRLAIDIQINFKGKISLTKTKGVRETYVLLLKLFESWNAYEAFFHYVKEVNNYHTQGKSIYNAFSQHFLSEVGSLPVLKKILMHLKQNTIVKFVLRMILSN